MQWADVVKVPTRSHLRQFAGLWIVFFGGLSLILMEYIDFDRRSTLPYGLFAVSVSLGFLLYYFLVKKELDK